MKLKGKKIKPSVFWNDMKDIPIMICKVILKDNSEINARWECGSWINMEGQEVFPIYWHAYAVYTVALADMEKVE